MNERFLELLFALLELLPEFVAFHVERIADGHLLAVDVVSQAEFREAIATKHFVVLRMRRLDQIQHVLLDETVAQLLEITMILILDCKQTTDVRDSTAQTKYLEQRPMGIVSRGRIDCRL